MMFSLGKKSSRTLALVIGAVSVLTTMLLASQAFAISSMSTTISSSAVAAGGKVDLTTQIPAVSAVDASTQEIIQNIDSTKVRLTSAADVVAPAGWTVTYSTDGTTFAATPSSWAAVVKVKATGTVNSLGATLDGKQIYSTTTTAPGTIVTANGAIRAGGDGFDTEFDSRGYIYNTYHHNAVNGSLDCRKKSDGSFCSANWPFALSTIGFSSNFSSTQFFDEVNKHLWLPVSDGATGTGFLCVDVTTVETPALCGGSKATAWHMLNSRVNALATSVIDIVAANGNVYTWDILSPKMLCYNYLANNGMGGPCSVAVPTMSKLVAGSVVASNNIPTTYTNLQVAFGNVYGQLNGVATCFNATTMGLCQGWAAADITLGTTSTNKLMYLQPDASGQIAGVCVTNDALCFAANGTRYAANATVQAAISNNNISRWRGSTATSGSKLLFTSNWILQSNPSYTYCFDYATNGPCANWPASTAFVTGVGQITTTNSKTYTLKTDPISSDCMWSNGDVFNGFGTGITQFTVSTGTAGCNLNVSTASYTQSQVQTRLTCAVGSDLRFDKFTIGGLTAGVDYSTAKFTILTSSGSAFVSGGTTWSDVAFNSSGYVDLTSISPADLGSGYSFKVDYANKTSTASSNGTLTMQSNSAQLCVSVTANKICPTTTQVGTPEQQVFNFSATGATISSSNVRIDYTSSSSDLTVAPALAADCGFQLRGQVSEGDKATAYPTTVVPVSGVVATLLNSAGTVLNDANNQPITATTDSSGNYSFGYLTAGTYKVRFADFALVNGVGPGDVVMVYIDPFRYQGGSYVMTPQNPPSFTAIQTPLSSLAVTGTTGGADVVVKASYIMRAVAVADAPKIKAGSATTIDVLVNDTPTTTDTWTTSSLKICAAGTTSSCALTTLTVAGQGTYSVSSGKIIFTPVAGFTGDVTPATYQISDSFSNTPQTVTALLSPTVVGPPTTSPDTLSGNLLSPITVDVTANDVAAAGATLDKASVKLCAVGTTTACALTSVTVTGKGVFSVSALGVVTFTPEAGFVGQVPALTYSITDVAGNIATNTVTATATATPPVVTTSTFPIAARGVAMPTDLQTVNAGTAAIPATGAWTILSGALPNGLSLDANTGAITGTPTALGTFNFTVKVTDVNGLTGTKAESITVYDGPTVTTTPTTQKIYTGASFTLANTATAGTGAIRSTGAWSATGLPNGLTIDGTTGVISGTPTTSGAFPVVVRVTDINGLFDEETINMNVVAKPAITTTTPLTPAVLGVAITPIAQTKTVGSNSIPATGAWTITSGVLPAGLSFNPDTGEITGTATQTGVFPFTVKLTDSTGEFGTKAETITVNSGPTITTTPTAIQAWVSEAKTINNTVTIGTGAIRSSTGWSATGLPNGLTINGSTGVISGTPTTAGSFTVTLRATDINGLFDEETLTITVGVKAVITTPTPLATAVVGVAITPISQTNTTGTSPIPATGAWSIVSGALPTGLSFNPDNGTISGTPTAGGSFTFTVKLTESSGEFSTKVETMTVNAPPAITTSPLSYTIFTGANSTIANTATPGTGAIRTTGAWSATGLPAGLTIDGNTGVISGTPASVGVSSVVLRVTDVNGLFDEETINIEVTPPVSPPAITTSPASYKFGVNNSLSLILDDFLAGNTKFAQSREIVNTATQGTAPIAPTGAWSATDLPPGLSIDANTGKIGGTGTQVGVFTTTVKVTDTAGRFATKALTIEITQGPINTTPKNYTYEVDIPKRIGTLPVEINQTWTLGSAPLNSNGRPVPFLVQGEEPPLVTTVSIVSGQIEVIPSLAKVGTYTLKTVIVDANGAFDIATFTFKIVKAGTNVTTLTLPPTIADGTLMNAGLYSLTGTSSKKLAVSYTVSTPKVCMIDPASKKLKLLTKGTCTVTAASGTGALLSKDTKSFVITKLPQVASVVAPGATIPGTSTLAPAATDDPVGFQLIGSIDTGAAPVYTSLDPNVCSVDAGGVVTWDADLTVLPKVETDFHCRVSVSHPGDLTHDAAPAQTITLDAVHIEPPAPEGGVAKDPSQVANIPAKGGSTPMKGGNSFAVKVDTKKKTVTVQPISKGRWIGPIYADIKISWTPSPGAAEETQICARNYFGIAVVDPKTKKIITPALGGDPLVVPEAAKNAKEVNALIKTYQLMKGKFATTSTVKGKKVTSPGYLDYKYFNGQATCVLNAKAYAAWKSGVKIKANATVTRDRRWPTTYARYKSYDWKNKSNNGIIYPTVVEWVINIG